MFRHFVRRVCRERGAVQRDLNRLPVLIAERQPVDRDLVAGEALVASVLLAEPRLHVGDRRMRRVVRMRIGVRERVGNLLVELMELGRVDVHFHHVAAVRLAVRED